MKNELDEQIVLDENGNRTIDGKEIDHKDPLSYFSKDAPIMHGRFGSYDVPRQRDRDIEAVVLADEERGIDDDVDPKFKAKIEKLLQFDAH
ncbi:MAG TPA: hypothetical protein VNN25_09090 [Thermoanaerobaculia bacterium]|nr:hypothetical protein [Thermoanaerobaculia bacterium]